AIPPTCCASSTGPSCTSWPSRWGWPALSTCTRSCSADDRGAPRPAGDDAAVLLARADLLLDGHRRDRRLRLHARLELDGLLRDDPDQALRDGPQLHAVGGAVVH